MELSLFLAKLFGIYMLVIAALMLLRKNQFISVANEIISSASVLTSLAGVINLKQYES